MARGKRAEEQPAISLGAEPEPNEQSVIGDIVNPGEIDAAAGESGGGSDNGPTRNKDGSIRKKRGPKASGSSKAVPLDVSAIQFSLTGIHSLLAIVLKAKELELTEPESKILSENVAAVGRHYDLVASQKSIDWFNLCMACATIYGTRIVAIGQRKAAESKANPRPLRPAPHMSPGPVSVGQTLPNGAVRTHAPTPEERTDLLNELPLSTSMQSH